MITIPNVHCTILNRVKQEELLIQIDLLISQGKALLRLKVSSISESNRGIEARVYTVYRVIVQWNLGEGSHIV